MPAAIDRIVALCEGSDDLMGVQILDGQPGVLTDEDVIVVGFSPDRLSVEGETDNAGLRPERETFRIVCLASAATGGPAEFKPLRDRADGFYETVRALILADHRLGGAVTKAACRTTALSQEHIKSENGSVTTAATVEFVVTCTAIT